MDPIDLNNQTIRNILRQQIEQRLNNIIGDEDHVTLDRQQQLEAAGLLEKLKILDQYDQNKTPEDNHAEPPGAVHSLW